MLGRLRFQIDLLVTEMLDQLPDSVWTSSTTTFLDPAMGGGQFVSEIERRLRNHGHSDINISSRVWGYEQNLFRCRYAVNKHNLVSTSVCKTLEDFLKLSPDMQFDVVVGNPPFKRGNETGGKSSLWRRIVAQSWQYVKPGGIMSMITPQFPNSAADLGAIFTEHQTTVVWTKIAQHFPGVGSQFTAWSVTKTAKTAPTLFINDGISLMVTSDPLPNDIRSRELLERVLAHPKFECRSSPEYFHTSVADGKDDEHLCSQPRADLPYALRRTSGNRYQMWGAVLPGDYELPKVVMTFSGNPHYRYHDAKSPIGTIRFQSGHILVRDNKQGENLIRIYESTLYRYIQQQMSSGGMRGKRHYELPVLDLDHAWTDAEIFAYFNLTPEEIELVTAKP